MAKAKGLKGTSRACITFPSIIVAQMTVMMFFCTVVDTETVAKEQTFWAGSTYLRSRVQLPSNGVGLQGPNDALLPEFRAVSLEALKGSCILVVGTAEATHMQVPSYK